MTKYSKVPVFENGMAQPVFPFTDGKTGENYDPTTSEIVRYCVYVESDYDMDGDGKRDLIKTLIQVPKSAVEGNYKAASLFEARPYCAGVNEDGYDHMKEVAEKEYRKFDFAELKKEVPAPITEFTSIEDIWSKGVDAEERTTQNIYDIFYKAREECRGNR